MKKYYIVLILIILFFANVFADTTYELRGSLREWVKVIVNTPGKVSLIESRLKLELLSTLSQEIAFKSRVYTVYSPKIYNEIKFNLQEAYIDYYTEIMDIRIGRQIISWGKADELNPTDILNPEDISNIFEEKSIRKIGVFGIKLDLKLFDSVITGIYIPDIQFHKLPEAHSTWDFFSIGLKKMGLITLPSILYPENSLDNSEWAIKISKTIENFDFTLSFADVIDNLFSIKMKIIPPGIPTPDYLYYNRTQMIAADFAASLFEFGVWAEVAYFITKDKDGTDPFMKNPYFQYVIGMDYTLPFDIKINIQYFREDVTCVNDDKEKELEKKSFSPTGLSIPVKQVGSLRLGKNFGEANANSLEIFCIYDIEEKGVMMGPRILISPTDAFKVETGAFVFDGQENSIFNMFNLNDEVYVKATYSF
ncbi:MAG: hypothetical protein N3E50_05975 [Candidatus Goldbacteria bacterium]|nr:hypothetical protein [Candidatus Goldiibacteriota bacterium]